MNHVKRIIDNAFYFLSSNLVNFSLGFLSSIILARSLKPTNLGIFHQVQWFASLASTLISLGFITSLIKFTAEFRGRGDNADLSAMVRYVIRIELFLTIFSTACLVLFRIPISDYYFSPNESRFFLLAFLAITPGMMTAILSALLEGCQVFKYQGIHAVTITPVALIIKIILMLKGFGVESLLWCNLGFSLVNLAYYYLAIKKEGLSKGLFSLQSSSFSKKSDFLRYNQSVFMISLVDQVVWNRSENYFLGRFCQASEVAYYNLSHNLVLKISGIIPQLMWKILLPVASEQEGGSAYERKKRTYYHAIRYSAFFLFPVLMAGMVCAYELIVIFFGQAYAEAESSFQILCLGAMLTALSQPGSAMIYAANRQHFIFWYGGILAIINITMNILLIPRMGAAGAAVCYTSVTVMGSVGGIFYSRKYMDLRVPWISLIKILMASLCMMAILFMFIRQNTAYFDFFPHIRLLLTRAAGINFDILLGPRTVRLLCGMFFSMIFYLVITAATLTPGPDDVAVIEAIKKYLPGYIVDFFLKWKQK